MNTASILAALPWARFLPESDLESLADDLSSATNPAEASLVLTEWQHTADLYANPDLRHTLINRESGGSGEAPLPTADGPEL